MIKPLINYVKYMAADERQVEIRVPVAEKVLTYVCEYVNITQFT